MSNNDFEITINESTNKKDHIISLSGNLTVDNATPIYNFLLNRAISKDTITLKVEKSETIDLSIVQLIIAFIDTRNKLNKKTQIEIDFDESIIELLDKSGSTELISSLQKK